jgi:hypothetical protein
MRHQLLAATLGLACLMGACKKDSKSSGGVAANSWHITPDDGLGPEVYKLKTATLRTNGYQVLEMTSEDNTPGGLQGISSSLTLYFSTIGPPPSGTYTVTSVEKLNGHTDQVAIYAQTYGSPRTGGNLGYWYSQQGSTQTITYKFENGKASASFKDIVIKQTGSGASTGTISASVSQ